MLKVQFQICTVFVVLLVLGVLLWLLDSDCLTQVITESNVLKLLSYAVLF